MNFKKLAVLFSALLLINALSICASEAQEKRPLFIYVFLHDDIPASKRASIRNDYFSWMIKDLESFTNRRVYLEIIEKRSALSGLHYKVQDLSKGLQDWTTLINRHIKENNLPLNGTTKYLLLTHYPINEKTLGYTRRKHYAAVASMSTYSAAAHEIGHMLDGAHEHSEVLFRNGWWCETNIYPNRESIRANCYVYSDKNKKAIANYLSLLP